MDWLDCVWRWEAYETLACHFSALLVSSSPVYHPVTYMGLVAIEQRLAATEVRPCSNLVSSSQDLPSVAMTKIGGAPVALDRSVHDLHNSTQFGMVDRW